MFNHRLYQGRVKSQEKNVRGCIDAYIYELRCGLHAGVKGLELFPLGIGVHGCCHVSANVKSTLDEVWIVPQGLYNMRVLLWLFLQPWHR
jgi:hypothetical protein